MGRKKTAPPETVEDIVALGNEAETLLASPAFTLACESLEDKYINCWMSSNADEPEYREDSYFALQALSGIKLELQYMINGGKIAKT